MAMIALDRAHPFILLCIAGVTPQIITETLYALTLQEKECVDEIRVIATLAGRNRILKDLLDPVAGKFFAFCRDYKIDPRSIKFDEASIALLRAPDRRMLEDVRTREENEAAADQICEIVRELTRDPAVRLHASAAGGRKTMSVYLTAAMQLFGRAQDRVSHVLVNEQFETHPDFYYIPPRPAELIDRQGRKLSTADAPIHLADIPFIRLRGAQAELLREPAAINGRSYREFVAQAQEHLDLVEAPHDLVVNLGAKTVMVEQRRARLTEREFFIYTLFAWYRGQRRGVEGFVALYEITREDLSYIFELITSAKGERQGVGDYDSSRYEFVDKLGQQIQRRDERSWKEMSKDFSQVKSRIKQSFAAERIPNRYLLVTQGGKGALRYGIKAEPERIVLR